MLKRVQFLPIERKQKKQLCVRASVTVRIHLKQKNYTDDLVQLIFERMYSTCDFCLGVNWRLWGKKDLTEQNESLGWPGTSCFLWGGFFFFFPLVTFGLFAVVSVFLWLRPFGLLLELPLLCVIWLGGGHMWPQSDDDAGHVITSCPVSRRVGGQTVLQQLRGQHVGCEIKDGNHAQC